MWGECWHLWWFRDLVFDRVYFGETIILRCFRIDAALWLDVSGLMQCVMLRGSYCMRYSKNVLVWYTPWRLWWMLHYRAVQCVMLHSECQAVCAITLCVAAISQTGSRRPEKWVQSGVHRPGWNHWRKALQEEVEQLGESPSLRI